MAELDIEALKRLIQAWDPEEARNLYTWLPEVITALEDRERLRAENFKLRAVVSAVVLAAKTLEDHDG